MLNLQKLVNVTLLATVLFSPAAAIAQQQSLTTGTGGFEQHVPCKDSHGKPIRCPWEKPIKTNLINSQKPQP